MEPLETPVLDNHLHLDPERGRGMDAVEEFARLGGTHLLVVNQPSWKLGVESTDPAAYRPVFETTCEIVDEATARLPGQAWAILGAHPGLISRLVEDRGCSPADARECMQGVLEVAADYVREGRALGLKSGRPHYEVSDAVWEASNDVMKHAFSLGAELDCAVQLHTEASEDLTEVADWAEARGLPSHRVVKHYAGGRLAGPTPSVMSNKEWIETAAQSGEPFLMETDFIDDPDRPGAVLGPKTVPRRVRWLREQGYDEAIVRAHVETPKRVYGIDTESTLV
ncbi:MAG: TatD family hydrolase [Halohasta sp.]